VPERPTPPADPNRADLNRADLNRDWVAENPGRAHARRQGLLAARPL